MIVEIYSLKKVLFKGEASSLTCQTVGGEITILDDHVPLITKLVGGIIKVVKKDGGEEFVPVKGGFLEVKTGGEVRCLVDE